MVDSKITTYDSVTAARYLMAIAYSKGKVLNVTKVQKLLYMAYGHFLAKKNRVLLTEVPKAWPFGPVFPTTRDHINFTEIISLNSDEFSKIKKDNEVTGFFNLLIDKYSKYSATKLSEWSHTKGSPWDLATKEEGFNWNAPIPNDLMLDYFSQLKF